MGDGRSFEERPVFGAHRVGDLVVEPAEIGGERELAAGACVHRPSPRKQAIFVVSPDHDAAALAHDVEHSERIRTARDEVADEDQLVFAFHVSEAVE